MRVSTDAGVLVGRLEGEILAFKGVPYAAPPVGDLRWAPAAAPLSWQGERQADAFGAACPQPDFANLPEGAHTSGEAWVMWTGVPMASDAAEDCLFLNIWAPKDAGRAPVMVFLHGGGGSGAIPWWDGSSFARDGVVLITINYRNFSQGKFAHPALTRAAGPSTRHSSNSNSFGALVYYGHPRPALRLPRDKHDRVERARLLTWPSSPGQTGQ